MYSVNSSPFAYAPARLLGAIVVAGVSMLAAAGIANASAHDDIFAAKAALQQVDDDATHVVVNSLIRDTLKAENDANDLQASKLAVQAVRVARDG